MSQFFRDCFETSILDDETLRTTLPQLCTPLDKARPGDIVAAIYPFAIDGDIMSPRGCPSMLLVRHANGSHLKIPWYTLVEEGLDERRIRLTAKVFARRAHHWCLKLSEQLQGMSDGLDDEPVAYDLFLGHDSACLIINDDDGDFALDGSVHTSPELIQEFIRCHGAIALPPAQNAHERLQAHSIAQRGNALLCAAGRLVHPYSHEDVWPVPRLSS